MPKKVLTEHELLMTAKAVDLYLYMRDQKKADEAANKIPECQKEQFMSLLKGEVAKTIRMMWDR